MVRSRRFGFVGFLFIIVFLRIETIHAQTSQSVLDVFGELTSTSLITELKTTSVQFVSFKPEVSSTFKRHIDLSVESSLYEQSFHVYESSSQGKYVALDYDIQSTHLAYERNGNQVIRHFEIALKARLQDETSKLIAIQSLMNTKTDTVLISDFQNLESTRFTETRAELSPTLTERATVPAITVSAIGIIVYLFFSVRSR